MTSARVQQRPSCIFHSSFRSASHHGNAPLWAAGAGPHAHAASRVLPLRLLAVGFVHYIYFDRSGIPDLEPFIRFELSTTGRVYDAQDTVLVEVAREYRRVVSYDEVPPILRDAILA